LTKENPEKSTWFDEGCPNSNRKKLKTVSGPEETNFYNQFDQHGFNWMMYPRSWSNLGYHGGYHQQEVRAKKKQEVLVQRTNPWGIQAVFLDFLAGQDV
jgi:hypothetical protein